MNFLMPKKPSNSGLSSKTLSTQFLSPNYKSHSKSTFNNSSLVHSKNEKIKHLYNSISNIYDSQEINNCLESLETVKEKLQLVDFVISRREEIKKTEEIEKLNKITPLINKMKRKYLEKTNMRKRSEDIDKSSEGSETRLLTTEATHYRRFSLRGKNLLDSEDPQEQPTRKRTITIESGLPRIEEGSSEHMQIRKTPPLMKSDKENASLSNIPSIKPEKEKASLSNIPSINIIKADKMDSPNSQKRRASMLTVVTQFNQVGNDKLRRMASLSTQQNNKPRLSFKRPQNDINSKHYNADFHLIPLETPRLYDPATKKYDVINQSSRKIHAQHTLYKNNIDNVLEKELLHFMTENRGNIDLGFLNIGGASNHKNIATIETKVKGKLKELLRQEKINIAQSKYYFRDTFAHKVRDSCKKCVKKKDPKPEIRQKASTTIKKSFPKRKLKSLDLMKIPQTSEETEIRMEGDFDNDDSFVSFTEMKLDQIYKETSEILKQVNEFDQKSAKMLISEKISTERKNKLKKLEGKSWEIFYLLKKKMFEDPNHFIFTVN